MWNVTVFKDMKIERSGFSQIIFNSDDVRSSYTYYVVYERFYTGKAGGFFSVPLEFADNFIMGVTSFEVLGAQNAF